MVEINYLQAINLGLSEEMERDKSVIIIGEDVGAYGGAFKVTEGLFEKFGEKRVIDTPIAESLIVGAAIGASYDGLRPVAEMQFADFIANGFDQIVNEAAKSHYRWGVKVPIVIRAPFGGNVHGGPFHSQCPEGWFFHTPGLKVVAPATPYDAKGLIKSAIRDDDPVIYFEHKYLYRRIKQNVPDEEFIVPIGKGEIKREGNDISVITYSAMVHTAVEAAEKLSDEGISLEIVDLRTLSPLDEDMILSSVKKCGKVIVLYEASRSGGVGSEVTAIIAEEGFNYLDAPPVRISGFDTPVPYSPPMEEFYLPSVDDVVRAAKKLAKY